MISLCFTRRAAAALLIAAGSTAATAHEGAMHVARSAAGELVIADFHFGDLFTLSVAGPPLTGWSSQEPFFEAIGGDDPAADLYALSAQSKIFAEVVLFTPGVRLWDHGLTESVSEPGTRLSLGPLPFVDHTHWQLDPAAAGYDPTLSEWAASFRLVDTGTSGYVASPVYTLRFAPVPAPATVAPLAGLALARRRLRR